MDEVWLPVVGIDGYEVSNLGRVRGRFGILKTFDKNGYRRLTLRLDGKTVARTVHQLVAHAFIGPRPDGMQICHGDGDRANNRDTNLRYDTQRNNVEDAIRQGTILAKLSPNAVLEIRAAVRRGDNKRLAEKYDVSPGTISAVVKRRVWKHV